MRFRGHLPALDGLRGVAILAVLWSHAQWASIGSNIESTLPDLLYQRLRVAGWMGVDLFFVLSGFLITGILLDAEKRDYFKRFYTRRTLRIFPLYYTFLIGIALTGIFHPALWIYGANVLVALYGMPVLGSLGHLWSLALEEQFYLVWPWVVRWSSPTTVARICLGVIVVALVSRLTIPASSTALYTLPPFRTDALAMGGLVAAGLRLGWTFKPWPFLLAGLGIVLGIGATIHVFSWDKPLMQGIGYTGTGLLATGLLLLTMQREWFNRPVLRFFGKYSYGIYVLHLPLLVGFAHLLNRGTLPPRVWGFQFPAEVAFAVVGLGGCTVVALLSWHLIEQPFLKLKDRPVPVRQPAPILG